MSMALSELIDNLSEGIHNNKCADCKYCLDYIETKNEKLILKCFNCEQYYKKKFKRFASTCEFCNKDLNRFILLLRKTILMNIWIIGKDLMKLCYLAKRFFIVT